MVQSISGSSSYQFQNQINSERILTGDQKELLEEILAKYDSDNMTSDSMKAMMEEIKATGITPSKDLRETMDAAGFKPPEKPGGPPPEELSDSSKDFPQYLLDFIEKKESGEVTQSDIDTLIESLTKAGELTQGNFLDRKI